MDLVSHNGGFLTLLKKRNFLRLWLAQLISQTIFNASNAALLVLIHNITGGSTTQLGLAIICFSLPAVLFGAPAGVVVDHMNKRTVLWGSNCLRALATLMFVAALFFNRQSLLPIIYLLTFIISTIGQFFTPAEGSTIPILVDEQELRPALSLFNITLMLAQALGYVIIGPLVVSLLPTFIIKQITIDSTIQLYCLIAILYLVCAGLILAIPASNFARGEERRLKAPKGKLTEQFFDAMRNVWEEMSQGWGFVRHNKILFLAVIQLSFAGVLILLIGELAVPIVTNLLLLPATLMSFIFAPAGVGLVVGSIFMPRILARFKSTRVIFTGAVVLASAMALLPTCALIAQWLQPHGWNTSPLLLIIIALLMCIAGAALDAINIPSQTIMQEYSPDWIKGRVLALQLVLYNAAAIPVLLAIGGITDNLGIYTVLFMMAVLTLAFGLWGIYYERSHQNQKVTGKLDTNAPSTPENSMPTHSARLH